MKLEFCLFPQLPIRNYQYNNQSMIDKSSDKSIMMYRPKKTRKNTYKPELRQEQKSQNLKELHKTLCEQPHPIKDRSSIQSSTKNKQPEQTRNILHRSRQPKRQSSINFYINVEKLKNFKIECRDKKQSLAQSNNLLKKTGMSYNRRSALLRNYQPHESKQQHAQSYEAIEKTFSNRQSEHKNNNGQMKSKLRYKTHGDDSMQNLKATASQHSNIALMKRPYIKKNEAPPRDKTFLEGYLRGKQLGRGGFSKVWQGFHFKSKTFFAIKQIDTRNKYQTHLTQIWFGNYFFENGVPKKQFANHPGVQNLLIMYKYEIVDPRAFIVYENCQGSLGNMLYDIYQEDRDDYIDEDDKLYMIKYKPLYLQLRKNTQFVKNLIYEIAQALDLLTQNKIVHSDLKTENILVNTDTQNNSFVFKLIDYGSSFIFESLKQYKLATPQYMCPQLLNYILYQNKKPCHQYMLAYVKNYQNISAIDVWGLGCIVLQLIHGLPLWLSNRTRLLINGKYETKRGLFAVSDRSFAKILQRQLTIVENFQLFLQKQNNSDIMIDKVLKDVIIGMLNPNPIYRIKPKQIIAMLEQDRKNQ